MKRQQTKASNDITLLVKKIKENRKLNDIQALSFLSGLFYGFATQENIEDIFAIASKKVGE